MIKVCFTSTMAARIRVREYVFIGLEETHAHQQNAERPSHMKPKESRQGLDLNSQPPH